MSPDPLALTLQLAMNFVRFVISRAISFLGDYFVIALYSLAWWGFFATDQPLDTYAINLVDTASMTFKTPAAALIGYLAMGYIVYAVAYRHVTTYIRWAYAVRILLLLVLPFVVALMVLKLAYFEQLQLLITHVGEGLVMIVAILVIAFLGWAFASMTYLISLLFSSGNSPTAKSLVFLPQLVDILFRRKPDFMDTTKPHNRQPFRRSPLRRR